MHKGTNKGHTKLGVCGPGMETVIGTPHVPAIARNTMIKGSAPKAAPIMSPQAPFTTNRKR